MKALVMCTFLAFTVFASSESLAESAAKPSQERYLGVRLTQSEDGWVVDAVWINSAAAKAGLRRGDIVHRVNSSLLPTVPAADCNETHHMMAERFSAFGEAVGEELRSGTVVVEISRDGKSQTFEMQPVDLEPDAIPMRGGCCLTCTVGCGGWPWGVLPGSPPCAMCRII